MDVIEERVEGAFESVVGGVHQYADVAEYLLVGDCADAFMLTEGVGNEEVAADTGGNCGFHLLPRELGGRTATDC
jgi:hypothetical protein